MQRTISRIINKKTVPLMFALMIMMCTCMTINAEEEQEGRVSYTISVEQLQNASEVPVTYGEVQTGVDDVEDNRAIILIFIAGAACVSMGLIYDVVNKRKQRMEGVE